MSKFESLEIELLIEALYQAYGFDFRGYSEGHMKRRILNKVEKEALSSVSALQEKVLNEEGYADNLIKEFSINVTEFFRDVSFYKKFKTEILPYLKSFPKIKIWHAGCSTGEEVYSMAIMLHEAGILNRCQIYGTDFNETVLELARGGSYSLDSYKTMMENHYKVGGTFDLSSVTKVYEDSFSFSSTIRERMSFHHHNLVVDQVFGEMTVIICRNVLIYFTKAQQDQVLGLFDKSLRKGGILSLGAQETIGNSHIETKYSTEHESEKIYVKKYC